MAQLIAVAGYVCWFAVGDAPAPFSLADWTFLVVPPAAFALLFAAGLLGSVEPNTTWPPRMFHGVGLVATALALAASLVMLPLGLFGSFMDYAIG